MTLRGQKNQALALADDLLAGAGPPLHEDEFAARVTQLFFYLRRNIFVGDYFALALSKRSLMPKAAEALVLFLG